MSVEARYLEPELPIELDDAYTQTFDRLRRVFRARGCSPEESADLAQEAAVRAFLHIRRWGVADGGLDPLLNRIARNLLIDRYRRVSPHLVPLDSAHDIHDPEQDPTEEVARRQRRRAVHHAIRELPSRHQRAITYSLSGMTPEEVGRQLGIGRNAADALLHRARRTLREHLAPVRDGMWGLALAVRIRYDRSMRRAGVQAGVGDATQLNALQSGITIATAAVVGLLSVGSAFGATPVTRSVFGPFKTRTVSAVTRASSPSASVGPPASGGGAAGGGGRATYSFGNFGGSSIGRDGTDTRIEGPRNKNGQPLFWVYHRHYGSDDPGFDPVAVAVDGARASVCVRASIRCSPGSRS